MRMRWYWMGAILLWGATGVATAQSAPPDSNTPGVAAAVEAYRQAWQRLTPDQQKAALQSGGYTPEQYERILRQTGPKGDSRTSPAPGTPDYNRGVSDGALDSLGGSLRDLNAIRDANVLRLQKDGCPAEVVSRIADLKGKLAAAGGEMNGLPAPAGTPAASRATPADPNEVAQSWFKAESGGNGKSQAAIDELDSVLPLGMVATNTRPANQQAMQAGTRRSTLGQEIASMQTEIDRLQGACAGSKR